MFKEMLEIGKILGKSKVEVIFALKQASKVYLDMTSALIDEGTKALARIENTEKVFVLVSREIYYGIMCSILKLLKN